MFAPWWCYFRVYNPNGWVVSDFCREIAVAVRAVDKYLRRKALFFNPREWRFEVSPAAAVSFEGKGLSLVEFIHMLNMRVAVKNIGFLWLYGLNDVVDFVRKFL